MTLIGEALASPEIVVLINEAAVSASEHSCLGFEEAAKGRITFIGTPTTGANGGVTNSTPYHRMITPVGSHIPVTCNACDTLNSPNR
jgi:C-terminal processing protease CtpA/Prc